MRADPAGRIALVVAERRSQADELAAEVLADQLRGEAELLAQRNVRRLGDHRLLLAPLGAVADVAEDDVAVGVLLNVEERRAGERLERVECVQERPSADEERARRLELLVQPSEERNAPAGRVGVERGRYWGTSGPMNRARPSPTAADSVS